MRRRTLLALCGSLAATAGCGAVGDRPSTESGDGPIQGVTVQPGVVGSNSPDSIGVYDEAGQYLVFEVGAGGPEKPAFSLRFDGETYDTGTLRQGLYRDGEWGVEYGDDGGPVLFALPETGDAAGTGLTWPDGEWRPGATVRERLAAPLPSFDVTLSGPDTAGAGDDPELELSVTNTGDIGGRYVLALNRIGPRIAYAPVGRIAGSLEPGQSTTHAVDAETPSGGQSVHYRLDAPGAANEFLHVIDPVEPSTPGATSEGPDESG